MMGINVRTDSRAGLDYASLIVTGRKTLETRATDSLAAYINRRVAIVRTGAGPARAIGSVRIVAAYTVDGPRFRALERLHAVPAGSLYDVRPDGVKWCYQLAEPRLYAKPRRVGRGIVARRVL
jgi:hypothetical protein